MVSASVWRPRQRSKKLMAWVRWLKRERLPLCAWPTLLSRKPLCDQGPMTSSLPACSPQLLKRLCFPQPGTAEQVPPCMHITYTPDALLADQEPVTCTLHEAGEWILPGNLFRSRNIPLFAGS